MSGIICSPDRSPQSVDSPEDRENRGDLNRVEKGNGGGDDGDDDDPDGNIATTMARSGWRFDDRGREFSLAKFSNIIIQTISGKNLHRNPYLPFNKSFKRLIYNQGVDGERLLEILEDIETHGATQYDNNRLKELAEVCPKAMEYNRAIMFPLFNYIISIAKGMVEHVVENGFDAWRRLYHNHICLAEDFRKNINARTIFLKICIREWDRWII